MPVDYLIVVKCANQPLKAAEPFHPDRFEILSRFSWVGHPYYSLSASTKKCLKSKKK